MINKLKDKLKQLAAEARTLSANRESTILKIKEIDGRLTQLVGAMAEINNIIKEIENEADDDNKPNVHVDTTESDGAESKSNDSVST